ncbi:hypothetical protein M0802_004551 [Mischocyttarus mexicanus]|nr:hypothetical protein M0802_004551 [Mischocyttarus mexicanus]
MKKKIKRKISLAFVSTCSPLPPSPSTSNHRPPSPPLPSTLILSATTAPSPPPQFSVGPGSEAESLLDALENALAGALGLVDDRRAFVNVFAQVA